MVVQIGGDEAYNRLRTIEQLGYIVSMSLREQNRACPACVVLMCRVLLYLCRVSDRTHASVVIQSLCIIIQSSQKDATFLDQRAEAFIVELRKLIEMCSDADWAKHAATVVARKTEKFKGMNQESSRLWEEVDNGRRAFDWDAVRVAQEVAKLSKAQVLAFHDAYIAPNAPKRAKLTAQVFGKNHPLPTALPAAGEVHVTRLADFKRALPLYPCPTLAVQAV